MGYHDDLKEHARRTVDDFEREGNLISAQRYAESATDVDGRDYSLAKLAEYLAAHDRPEALDLVHSIQHPFDRADSFLAVGRGYARNGAIQAARVAFLAAVSAADAIPRSTWETPSLLLEVGIELRAIGDGNEALDLIRRASSLARRGGDVDSRKALGACAVTLAKWGYGDEAMSIAKTITDNDWRDLTTRRVVAFNAARSSKER
jgi:hypothetical protein